MSGENADEAPVLSQLYSRATDLTGYDFVKLAKYLRDEGATHVSAGGFSVQFSPRPVALPPHPADPPPEERAARNLSRNRANATDDDFTAEEREYIGD